MRPSRSEEYCFNPEHFRWYWMYKIWCTQCLFPLFYIFVLLYEYQQFHYLRGGGASDFNFRVFCSFLATISPFLIRFWQVKYQWNLWDEIYFVMKKNALWCHRNIDKIIHFFSKKKQVRGFLSDRGEWYLKSCVLSVGSNCLEPIFRFLPFFSKKVQKIIFFKNEKHQLQTVWAHG